MAETLSILASLTIVGVVIIYFRNVTNDSATPNPSTWGILLVTCSVNTYTYFAVAQGNLFEWAITITVTIGVFSIFLYTWIKGKFGKTGIIGAVSFPIAIGVLVYSETMDDPITANWILQAVYVMSFVPTVAGVLSGDLRERALPWALGVFSYLLLIVAIVLDWGEGSGAKLVHPIINGVLGNGSVVVSIWWTRTSSPPCT